GNYFTWGELWNKYIKKLKHASGNELYEIFGNNEHIFNISSRQLCAAFIRTYHHQLAYQIAVYGFLGKDLHDPLFGISEEYSNLVGILAKSHGIALRDSNLEKEIKCFGYDNNLPLNVPIYYLMSVLRLADLLDADENRAPKILSDMNEFSSPRSEQEWILNQLIKGRQWPEQTGKPDTLKMIAYPKNSKHFLELKSWFDYWQKELDLCWAVIGETHNDKYKLSIRRITSNIFNTSFDFVTNPIELKVNPDIVKLLVAPLYGDHPSYGVRELLQNAIDACNERTEIDGTIGEIVIEVDEKTGIFKISDNGCGMTEEIIANYYLTAGASYRYNRQWTEKFLDSECNPKIIRSGRFGIGALATFLIGNKAKVTTRHISDKKGYCFEYTIEPKFLNIDKIEKTNPGTTIEIVMNQKAMNQFTKGYWHSWIGWYHFTK
ncbi:MAG: ATP-binding protein, partial [Allobaculum sp.]|nr:ATP-binding protein [Allobaculum sp.]